MQKFRQIRGQDRVKDSRMVINDNFESVASNFSGTSFPTTGLFVGMICYRTDVKTKYILRSLTPPVWEEDLPNRLRTARKISLHGKAIGKATLFHGGSDVSIEVIKVTADSCTGNSATATTAKEVQGALAKENVSRHVWFSGVKNENNREYSTTFFYNPMTDTLNVGKIIVGQGVYGNVNGTATSAGTATRAIKLSVGERANPLIGREEADVVVVYRASGDKHPHNYGNIITIGGDGGSQLFLGWSNVTNGVAPIYYRYRRDVVDTWGPWQKIIFASDLSQALNGKANTSHGNHVPATEPANNTRFLRNDNTWQPVTPGNIGAYTRSEVDGKLGTKAPLNSPPLVGTPTAPTAPPGTKTTQIANTAFVAQAITSLINGAPATLNTLQELSKALGDDANFAAKVTAALAGKLGKAETAVNANGLGGKSLQWILDQISAAKTGIIASSLAQNGWVKFAGGLILQWGVYTAAPSGCTYPIQFPNICFCVLATRCQAVHTDVLQANVESWDAKHAVIKLGSAGSGHEYYGNLKIFMVAIGK